MDEVLYILVLLVFMVALLIFLLYNGRLNLDMSAEELNERLDFLEEGVKVIGIVLERIPELVPQFTLQNSNPFQSLLDAFAARIKENMSQPSITDPALRDPSGRFTDGEKEEEIDPA